MSEYLVTNAFKAAFDQTTGALQLPQYVVSAVPAASANPGSVIVVTNDTSGWVLAVSNGTNWRAMDDALVISA